MNLTLDHALVALAILGALAFLARRFFGKKKGCSSGCGCEAAKPPSKKPVISTKA